MATSSMQKMCKFCEDHLLWTVAYMISGSLNTILFCVCYLKENVYKNNPHSLEPQQNIEGCILNTMTEIPHKLLVA